MAKSRKWSKMNPAPLPVKIFRHLPVKFMATNTKSSGYGLKELLHQRYLRGIADTSRRIKIEEVVYGDNLEEQMTIMSNQNLDRDDLIRLIQITENMDDFENAPGFIHLYTLICSQPNFPSDLLLQLAKTHSSRSIILKELTRHPNADDETKVLAALTLGSTRQWPS